MTRSGFMVDRCINPSRIPVLIDLGYVKEKASRDRADALRATGISGKNFSIEGAARLLLRPPPKKLDVILKQFPIVAGSTYFQTTHHWRGLGENERVAKVPTSKGLRP